MRRHRVTMVVAAAGWGKSSALRAIAELTDAIEIPRPPLGWTPFSLARALVDGFVRRGAGPGPGIADALPRYPSANRPDSDDQAAALAATVCEVAAQAVDEAVVVLDDAELDDGDPLAVFLETLVLHLPRSIHLVLAARHAPPLRLARLRAAGEVARIGSAELAVRPDDVAPTGPIAEIVSATGGWPLAVHLASEASRRNGALDRSQLVEHLLAPDAVLFDYLANDVLSTLTAQEQQLLALISRTPKLFPHLLDDLGRSDLIGPLVRLQNDRIFVEPVPDDPGGARATMLGREFVRRALPPPADDIVEDLVLAFIGRGDLDAALELAAEVRQPGLARRVVMAIEHPHLVTSTKALAATLDLAERGAPHPRVAEVRGDLHYRTGAWDAALESYALAAGDHRSRSVRLVRKQAAIHYLRGELDAADEACATLELDGTNPAEEAWVLAWRAVVCWTRGDTDACEAFVIPAVERATRAGDDAALAMAYTAKAMLAALRGDLHSNLHLYQRALDHARRAGDVVQIVRIHTNRASRLTEEGRCAEALAELDTAIGLAELTGSDNLAALAYNNRGEALLATGQLDAALAALRTAESTWTALGSRRVLYAIGNLAAVQHLRGQRAEAIALFEESVRMAESLGDAQGAAASLIGLARALRSDHPDAAAETIERALAIGQAIWMPHAYAVAASIAHRRNDPAAIDLAARAVTAANARRDRPALAEALLVQAELATPTSIALAEESARLCHELGDPIGRARAELVGATSLHGRDRERAIAEAEQTLFECGALGVLSETRQRRSGPAAGIAIETLGGFRVIRGGEPIEVSEWGSRKARDLVKLLVARRGAPVVRDEAIEVLWPDDPERSMRRLSVLLSTARGVLDPAKSFSPEHYINADHDTIWLVREHLEIDVELFLTEAAQARRAAGSGDTAEAYASYTAAAARYLGDFCADDPYADWLAGIRELARNTFVDTSFELAKLADGRGEHNEAIRHWLRCLDVDPYDEEAHLGMVRSLLAQRRHGDARRAYRAYCGRIAELDVEPAPYPD